MKKLVQLLAPSMPVFGNESPIKKPDHQAPPTAKPYFLLRLNRLPFREQSSIVLMRDSAWELRSSTTSDCGRPGRKKNSAGITAIPSFIVKTLASKESSQKA